MEYLANVDVYCQKFLDQTVSPFEFVPDALIPDGYQVPVSRLVDYYDTNPFTLPASLATGTASVAYVGFYLTYGQNEISQNIKFVPGLTTSDLITSVNPLYSWVWFIVDANGIIGSPSLLSTTMLNSVDEKSDDFQDVCSKGKDNKSIKNYVSYNGNVTNLTAIQGQYFTYGYQNYNTITGSTTQNGFNSNIALVTAMRSAARGLRIWPTTEVVTNTAALYVMQYYGCSMNASQLNTIGSNGDNLLTAMKESANFMQTSNAQGMCGRFNVAQQTPVNPIKMTPLPILDNSNFNTDDMLSPLILVQWSTVQTWTAGSQLSLPINIRFQEYFEAVLRKPTPIISISVPLALDFDKCLSIVEYMQEEFPLITEGHSFTKFLKTAKKIVSNPIVKSIASTVINSNPLTAGIYDVTKNVIKQPAVQAAFARDKNQMIQAASRMIEDEELLENVTNPRGAIQSIKARASNFVSGFNRRRRGGKKKNKNSGGMGARSINRGQYATQLRTDRINAKANANPDILQSKKQGRSASSVSRIGRSRTRK